MKKAKAMYIPAGGKTAVWGPVDHNVLPEGYPYKEVTVTKEPVDLSLGEYWLDENPREDRVHFSPGMQMYTYCKISDGTLSNDDVRKLSITMIWDGELKTINYSDLPDDAFIIEDDYVVVNSGLYPTTIIVRKPNALVRVSTQYDDLVLFNKVGFYIDENLSGPASIKTVEPVFTFTTETIHTMAPEFLPAGVGGGAFVVIFASADGQTFTCDRTFAEIETALSSGLTVRAELAISYNGMVMHQPLTLSQWAEGSSVAFTSVTNTNQSIIVRTLGIRSNEAIEFVTVNVANT